MPIRTPCVFLTVALTASYLAVSVSAQEEEKTPKTKEEPTPVLLPGGGGQQMAMGSSSAFFDATLAAQSFSASGHTGAFSTSVPIRMPSFRGLEPSVALTYTSSGGNGFVGVGWSVSGFSRIERKSADGGWPNWDTTDTFWFGGQKLIACGASASPGCTSGGTHFAELENYLRITDNGDDTWTVTNRSGVQTHYAAMGATGPVA